MVEVVLFHTYQRRWWRLCYITPIREDGGGCAISHLSEKMVEVVLYHTVSHLSEKMVEEVVLYHTYQRR